MADLSSSGSADNVAATDQRIAKASLELTAFAARVEQLRFMPGLLDLSRACDSLTSSLISLSEAIKYFHSSLPDQPDGSLVTHRLDNQIRHNSD